MEYSEEQARELLVEAGQKLFELGLVARTWGNISARISDTQFVITPSGRPYDTITPEQIVVANISDWKYTGELRPSDEIGIHAEAFRIRPDVNFVIHTHQHNACIIAATETPITYVPEEYRPILGDYIPCGDYGLPATKKLVRGVTAAAQKYPQSRAVIMKHHGTACFGKDFDDTFNIALALEEVCKITIENKYLERSKATSFDENAMRDFYLSLVNSRLKMPQDIIDLGCSKRHGDKFTLKMADCGSFDVPLDSSPIGDSVPSVAKIHKEIYNTSSVQFISHLSDPNAVALSVVAAPMKSYLDDYAQIAGTVVNSCAWDESDASAKVIARTIRGKNAVLVKNLGAICTANNAGDLTAINIVMAKGCEAQIAVKLFGNGEPIGYLDRLIMRKVYTLYYSKQADKKV
ncbi:MAG: class II aldolase/adducin family protein [Oscillospiraceae bacterium]